LRPGFSTAATVTSVSGRGVGMDVVRTNIDQIGGTIDIKSVAGEGSSVTIKIPLTLAIVLGADCRSRRRPLRDFRSWRWSNWCEARANSEHRIERIKDTAVLRLAQQAVAADAPEETCSRSTTAPLPIRKNGFIVVTQVGSQTFGIVVDGVFHTEEIVVKPMSTKLASHRHVSRATPFSVTARSS